jgi:hypothetical protein
MAIVPYRMVAGAGVVIKENLAATATEPHVEGVLGIAAINSRRKAAGLPTLMLP